jgi:hypothetical protein
MEQLIDSVARAEGARAIELTQGYYAVVDEDDYERLSKLQWYAHRQKRRVCAKASVGGGDKLFLHRVVINAPAGQSVDHINGDALDNRKKNLRLCDALNNSRGFRRKRVGVSSRFRGVYFYARDSKWVAEIKVNGRGMYLGRFDFEEQAGRAYDDAAVTHFGEFATLNFPREMA